MKPSLRRTEPIVTRAARDFTGHEADSLLEATRRPGPQPPGRAPARHPESVPERRGTRSHRVGTLRAPGSMPSGSAGDADRALSRRDRFVHALTVEYRGK